MGHVRSLLALYPKFSPMGKRRPLRSIVHIDRDDSTSLDDQTSCSVLFAMLEGYPLEVALTTANSAAQAWYGFDQGIIAGKLFK